MKPKTKNLVQVNIAVLIWGGTAMFAKGIKLPVQHIICIRSLIAAAVLLMFLLITRTQIRVNKRSHWGVMLILGLLLCAHWLTYFQALKEATAAVAILSLATYPVFTALLEPFIFKEKLKKSDVLMAGGVLLGVIIMTPEVSMSNRTTYGIALGIISGLFFMTRNLMIRKYVQDYTSSMLMFWQTLVTGAVLVPVLFVFRSGPITTETAWLFVVLGIFFTALPQTLFSAGFNTLSAKTVAVLAALLPFYGAFFGYLIHNETVSLRTAIGGLIILVCIIFETVKSARS